MPTRYDPSLPEELVSGELLPGEHRTPIDPALRELLNEEVAAACAAPVPANDEEHTRAIRAFFVTMLQERTSIPGLPNAVVTHDISINPGLTARLYRPPGTAVPYPVLLYGHGGGWVAGSVETLDPFCRLLSEAADILIASLEYRLLPEHPYPAALEDTLAAVRWAEAYAADWGGDPSRLALGGDSAGANLAAVTANRLCAENRAQALRAQLLLYPVTDHPGDAGGRHLSYTQNAASYGLDTPSMLWYWQQYASTLSPDDPSVSPLRLQNVPALPPTLIATADYDVLRDEGIAYAQKLAAAGVDVTHLHAPDMHHDFPVMPATIARFPQASATLAEIAAWLRQQLGSAVSIR